MRESDLLFPARNGGYRTSTALTKPFDDVCRVMGLKKKISARAMRRTFQDLAREANIDSIVQRSICGHATPEMSHLYSTVGQKEIQRDGFRIANPELEDEIARARQPPTRGAKSRELDAGPSAPSRPPVHDIADAYRRHLEDVKRAPEGRNVDASRLDALVAVRLRATGYDHDQVHEIIKAEASRARPEERRDWNEYARRVTEHAFGLPREQQVGELSPRVSSLFEIEGRPTARRLALPRRDLGDRGRER